MTTQRSPDDDDASTVTVVRPAGPAPPGAVITECDDFHPMRDAAFAERYEVTGVLGRGGMGVVYRGVQRALKREVAIKFLEPVEGRDARRFEREGTLAARLDHRNVVKVHDAGVSQGRSYLVMECVRGETLHHRLTMAGGRLPVAEVLAVLEQVLDGLEHIHAAGALHRDLKPANIFLAENGVAKIGDFGVAWVRDEDRLTKPGEMLGTPLYMAPEQFTGEAHEPASDLYALGAIMYHLLTGQPPFKEATMLAYYEAHRSRPPTPLRNLDPALPVHLEALVMRALEKDPARRPRTALHFRKLMREEPPTFDAETTDGSLMPLPAIPRPAPPAVPAPAGAVAPAAPEPVPPLPAPVWKPSRVPSEERPDFGARELTCLALIFVLLAAGMYLHARRRGALPEWPRTPITASS